MTAAAVRLHGLILRRPGHIATSATTCCNPSAWKKITRILRDASCQTDFDRSLALAPCLSQSQGSLKLGDSQNAIMAAYAFRKHPHRGSQLWWRRIWALPRNGASQRQRKDILAAFALPGIGKPNSQSVGSRDIETTSSM